ncbi:hypothetical protein PPTG_20462 [Phytophthora nicotianae INRA-310]|uniref:Uncharacterized protein n=1 Tax=Phytophthora nicotianae (strain INRA-310) TaxID=761204 RepID=W2P933_PHYN3|nr:hypothetical protein PPTG_20462 [Phytophthora nicotianae INRA-310]ETM97190.1 hypothetical protein PPTG_20462 [Phytophthora nicotianae INRA-310]
MYCPGYQQPMRFRVPGKTKHWRCCRKKRHNDAQAARLLYAWSMRASHANAAKTADVSEITVEDWYGYVRCLCSKQLLSDQFWIGGVDHVVEIDETSLTKKALFAIWYVPSWLTTA